MSEQHINEWDRQHPAPFTLFRNEEGKWGTLDANGNVYDRPIYNRIIRGENNVTYYDGYCTACEFNPETGMEILAWGQPWWEDAFSWAKYPDEYNYYIFEGIRACRQLKEHDGKQIAALNASMDLTPEQHQALSDIEFYSNWNSLPDDADDEVLVNDWFNAQPKPLTPQQRVDCLAMLMQSATIDPGMKSTIWYGNFCFIDTFLNNIQ